jgi:hypothetical protein
MATPTQNLSPKQPAQLPQQPIQQPQAQMPLQTQPVISSPNSLETQTHTFNNTGVSQSAVPIEPAKKHHSNNHKNNEYNSNPFVVAGKGLGSALVENPTSSIFISLIPSLVILPAIIAIGLLFIVLSLTGGAIGALLAGIVSLVFLISFLILVLRVTAGSINILLKSINGKKISIKEAIGSESSGRLLSLFGVYLLSSLAVIFGFLLFIIPGIYLLARLSLAPVIVYAEDKKAIDSLKRSMALTKGHVFEMLGAITAQSMLSGNGLLSLVGASSGTAKRYTELATAEKSGIKETGQVHWLNYVLPILLALFIAPYIALSVLSAVLNTNSVSFSSNNDISFSSVDSQNDTNVKNDINSLHTELEVYYNENGGYPNEAMSSSTAESIFGDVDTTIFVDENGNEIEVAFENDNFYSGFPEPNKTTNYGLLLYGEGCDGLGSTELCSSYVLSGYQSNGLNYVKYSLN